MDQARKVGEKEKEKRQKEKDGYRGVTGLIEIGKPLDLYCEKGSSSVFFSFSGMGYVCMFIKAPLHTKRRGKIREQRFQSRPSSFESATRIIRTIIPSSFCLDFIICLNYCSYVTVLV